MQLTSNNTTLSPQVQSILPVLKNLNINERLSVISFLAGELQADTTLSQIPEPNIAQKPFNIFPNAIAKDSTEIATPLSREEIAKKRLGFFQGQMTMSDDFDEYLGDDFWFPEDDTLYK